MFQQSVDFISKLDESIKSQGKQRNQLALMSKDNNENQIFQNSKIQNENQLLQFPRQSSQKVISQYGNNSQLIEGLQELRQYQSDQFQKKLTSKNDVFKSIDSNQPALSLFSINYVVHNANTYSDDGDDEKEPECKNSYYEAHDDHHLFEEEPEPLNPIIKFSYTQTTHQLLIVPIFKFRKNNNEVLETGSIAIEKSMNHDSFYVVYRQIFELSRNKLKQIQYIGQLVKNLSELKPLGQNPQNIILRTVSRKDSVDIESQKDQFTIDTLKMMFEDTKGLDQFKAAFNQYFK